MLSSPRISAIQEASEMRSFNCLVLCAAFCTALALPVLAQQVREPASYPHDMSDFGCVHKDENVCDQAPAPPPDYNPLIGTWVRYSLLRNGFSVQPPDAPLYVKFGPDGWWSMMEFPANRPKVNKSLDQQTPQELFSRFDKLGGGWGNYSNIGMVNYRHHLAGLGPGGGESSQERAWRFEGNILILEGTGPTRSPQVHARKLPNQPLGSRALVGTWERTAYTVNGAAGATTPEHLILGEDGWYHATVLPSGRQGVQGKPMAQWTTQEYVGAYGGMSASRGTYNVQGNTFVRRHIADVDPNLENKLSTGTFNLQGDTFTWQGTDAAGQKFSATYRKMKPFDVYAPLPPRAGGAARGAAPGGTGPAPARGSGAQ
jgi:hypothetical protein